MNTVFNLSPFSSNNFILNCDWRFMHSKGHKTNCYVLWLIKFIINWINPIREHVFNKPTNYWTNCNTNLRYIVTLHISTHLYHRRLTKTNWEIIKFKISHTTQLPNIFLLISTLFLFPCTAAAATPCCWFRCYSAVCLYVTFLATIGLQWRVSSNTSIVVGVNIWTLP